MRIGVDLRPLQNNNKFRGIGKLTEYLLIAMSKISPDHHFVFYVDSSLELPTSIMNLFPGHSVRKVRPNYISKIKYIRAFAKPYSLIDPKSRDIDVLLQTDPWNGIPKNVPTVAYFHDIIPLLFKIEDYVELSGIAKLKHALSKRIAARNYNTMLESYKSARHIIAISESSRTDYLKYVDNSPRSPITVVTPSLIGGTAMQNSTDQITKRLGLKNSPYLLYVGGIDLRKNIIQLLHDLKTLRAKYNDLKLVLVGKEFTLQGDLAKLGWSDYLKQNTDIKDAIVYAGFVEQEDILSLYRSARAFVFPSKYEGFGLPILEAMDANCPVVCYNNSSIPEVAGNATLMIEDGKPMAPSIELLLTDEKLRKTLISKGKSQLNKFSWDESAKSVLAIVESAIR